MNYTRLFLASVFISFTPSVFPQVQPFRFAWLTDTHVGSATGADDLRASVSDINAIKDIAFTVLSGDVTEFGRDAELELAKVILDSLKKPYYIIPGNHDTKWSESGCTKFPKLFGGDRFVFEHHAFRFIGLHEGPVMRMGDGHFAPEDLRWMDSVLTALPDKEQPLVFVTHYPLDAGIDNWFEMVERLTRVNTKVVLVGHGHASQAMNFGGIAGVMGRSNLRAKETAGGYTLVEARTDTMYFSERKPAGETTNPWYSVALNSPRRAHTEVKPDFSINEKYTHVQARWSAPTGYTIASAPAVSKDVVVVGNSNGTVECYRLNDGRRVWKTGTGGPVYSSPQICDERAVFGSADGNVYCLDITNGSVCWSLKTDAPVVAAPCIADGVVYIGGSDRKFRAIDVSTGKMKWESGGLGSFVEARPLVYQEKVFFGAWDTYLYALDRANGSLCWKWSNGNATLNLSPAACWPVASAGRIYVVAPDRFATAFEAGSGKVVWRTSAHQVREAIGISEDGSRIYAKGMNDTLFAFSSSLSTPRLVWSTACGYGYDIAPSMPQEKDGTLFFGTKNGLVYALDGATGAIRWIHRIGVTMVNTVTPVAAGRVVVTDFDGRICLLEGKR